MAHQIQTGATATADVTFYDAAGSEAAVDGLPEWSSSDDAVMTVDAAEDGMSAVVTAVAAGTAQLQLVADARVGPDVVELRGTADVEVIPSEAVTATITFQADDAEPLPGIPAEPTPEPIPEPAPDEPAPAGGLE
jgi:hypothetical protein